MQDDRATSPRGDVVCLAVAADDRVNLVPLRGGKLGEVFGHVPVAPNHEYPMRCHEAHIKAGWFRSQATH